MSKEGAIGQSAPQGKISMECPSRHNFDKDCEKAFNAHIHSELVAAYHAQNMWAFFSRDCKAAVGMARLAEWASHLSSQRARRIAGYVIARGGHVEYYDLPKPQKESWDNIQEAFEHCVANKKKLYTSLQSLYNCCEKKDAHCSNFIQDDLMDEVVAWNKFLSDCLANLNCIGSTGLSAWVFDRWLTRIVMSKFLPPEFKSLNTKHLETKMPNDLFDAEGDMLRKALKI